jgi:hypothetical protein
MRRLFLFFSCLGLVLLAQCAEQASIEGRPCPCADGFRCCAAADVCVAAGAACPVGFVASRASIERVCAGEHGPALDDARTAASFARFLARRWFVCNYDARSVSGLVSHEGIEFTTAGTWSYLRATPAGYERGDETGTYRVYNDTLKTTVAATDTTPGHDLHIEWTNAGGPLDLYMHFEHSPLRFRTNNGIELWFVADGSDGSELIGDEGVSCESDHTRCKPGSNCVSELNAEMCARPVSNLGAGEGCDRTGTRTCAPPLACLATRQCGAVQ